MTRKDQFLRALQRAEPRLPIDSTLAFRLALNLSERAIPPDLVLAAHQFAQAITRGNQGENSLRENRVALMNHRP